MSITILMPQNCYDESDFTFIKKYNVETRIVTSSDYKEIIDKIPINSIILNLCDGCDQDNYVGVELIKYLEEQKRIFIGTSSKNYYWTKTDLRKSGIVSPQYLLVNRTNYVDIVNSDNMKFPQIVKPNNYAGGSDGIYMDSKVENLDELRKIVEREINNYNELIIEEFIDGREFSSLAFGKYNNPEVLKPVEYKFLKNDTFKHYDLKWNDYLNEQPSIDAIRVNDTELSNRIVQFTNDVYRILKLDGYVRFDIRMDQQGNLYLLDVNTYCGIFYKPEYYGCADYIIAYDDSINHENFLDKMIEYSLLATAEFATE